MTGDPVTNGNRPVRGGTANAVLGGANDGIRTRDILDHNQVL
jgi:hypothetical protein